MHRQKIIGLAFILFHFSGALVAAEIPINQHAEHLKTNKPRECYVWFETNSPKYLNLYIDEFSSWNKIGFPIISARMSNAERLTQTILNHTPSVITGFKTSDAFQNRSFTDERAWKEIANLARKLSKLTGNNPVVLENEGAVKKLLDQGVKSIKYNNLVDSISKQNWPEVWFWYAPHGTKEPVRSIAYDIARAVKVGIPNSRLIEPSSTGYSNSRKKASSIDNLRRTYLIDSNPISIVYLDDNRKHFWRVSNTGKAVQSAESHTVIIYPGFNDLKKARKVLESPVTSLCNKN